MLPKPGRYILLFVQDGGEGARHFALAGLFGGSDERPVAGCFELLEGIARDGAEFRGCGHAAPDISGRSSVQCDPVP
jgi:hypothetical protein